MRININYLLSEETEKECFNINQMICEQIPTCEINFAQKICRPHITLFMGDIDDEVFDEQFEKIGQIVRAGDLHFCAFDNLIKFSKIYFKNNYIMCDVEDPEPFVKDCTMIIEKLGNFLIKPHKFQIANGTTTPHITLGFCNEKDLPENFLKSLPKISETRVCRVECSKAGKHGTVLI